MACLPLAQKIFDQSGSSGRQKWFFDIFDTIRLLLVRDLVKTIGHDGPSHIAKSIRNIFPALSRYHVFFKP